ncbi:hypothetical protein JOD29_001102 [Lysinibacillus composti]|nr:hypothetical protein [Lysinibacillus composti]
MAWEIQRILPRIQNVNKIIRKAEAARSDSTRAGDFREACLHA